MFGMMVNTAPFALTGHPALSLTIGYLGKHPVGGMIVGQRFQDATVLQVAHSLEWSLKEEPGKYKFTRQPSITPTVGTELLAVPGGGGVSRSNSTVSEAGGIKRQNSRSSLASLFRRGSSSALNEPSRESTSSSADSKDAGK